jgi:hypothetical protein
MPDLSRFRALSYRERALVAIGVLLDGLDAVEHLACDKNRKIALQRAAKDIVALPPDLRMPLLGTVLRESLSQAVESPHLLPPEVTGKLRSSDLSEET